MQAQYTTLFLFSFQTYWCPYCSNPPASITPLKAHSVLNWGYTATLAILSQAEVCACSKLQAANHTCWAKPGSIPNCSNPASPRCPTATWDHAAPWGSNPCHTGTSYSQDDSSWTQENFSHRTISIGIFSPSKWCIPQHRTILRFSWTGCWNILPRLCFCQKGWARRSLRSLPTWYAILQCYDSYSTQALHGASLWDTSWRWICFSLI